MFRSRDPGNAVPLPAGAHPFAEDGQLFGRGQAFSRPFDVPLQPLNLSLQELGPSALVPSERVIPLGDYANESSNRYFPVWEWGASTGFDSGDPFCRK